MTINKILNAAELKLELSEHLNTSTAPQVETEIAISHSFISSTRQ